MLGLSHWAQPVGAAFIEVAHDAPPSLAGLPVLGFEVAPALNTCRLPKYQICVAAHIWYLGQSAVMRSKARKAPPPEDPGDPVCA